jgi:hypothetical protein
MAAAAPVAAVDVVRRRRRPPRESEAARVRGRTVGSPASTFWNGPLSSAVDLTSSCSALSLYSACSSAAAACARPVRWPWHRSRPYFHGSRSAPACSSSLRSLRCRRGGLSCNRSRGHRGGARCQPMGGQWAFIHCRSRARGESERELLSLEGCTAPHCGRHWLILHQSSLRWLPDLIHRQREHHRRSLWGCICVCGA